MATYLQSLPAVTALIGQRVYQLILPQIAVYPALRVQLFDEDEPQHLRGPSGLVFGFVQIDSYAQVGSGTDPYEQATTLGAVVHNALMFEPFTSPASPSIEMVAKKIGRQAMFEPDERRIVRIMQQYKISAWN